MASVDSRMSSMSLYECVEIIKRHAPEPIREHWCEADGVRYPAKQAFQLLTGQPRSQFTSHQALRGLKSVGFTTSSYHRKRTHRAPSPQADVPSPDDDSGAAFSILSTYLAEHQLTSQIADAEAAFAGADLRRSEEIIYEYLFSEDLLDAALEVRKHVGRLNDVIHATVIARAAADSPTRRTRRIAAVAGGRK